MEHGGQVVIQDKTICYLIEVARYSTWNPWEEGISFDFEMTSDAAHIVILGTERTGEREWQIRVNCGDHPAETAQLVDPYVTLNPMGEEDLRWYLEDFAPKYPYDMKRAGEIKDDLIKYGQTLVENLQVLSIAMLCLVLPSRDDRDDPIIIDVMDSSSPSPLHSIHWEVLEKASTWNIKADKPVNLIVRRKIALSPPLQPLQVGAPKVRKSTFNILLVSSRPYKSNDIDPLLGTRCIIETLSTLNPRQRDAISLEIVRPGTWVAFEKHITARTNQWWASDGTGAWFDLVHFDVHGEIVDGRSYLIFLSQSGKNALAVPAEDVAELLQGCKVEKVFINSCRSAKALGLEVSNLAEVLITKGIRAVMAMSYVFTSSAAKIFISSFYSKYLNDVQKNMTRASKFARDSLQTRVERTARFGLTVSVADFIVPVLYLDHDWEFLYNPPDICTEPVDPNMYTMNASLQPSIVRVLAQNDLATQLRSNHAHFSGREQDIMEIENLLLRKPKENILILHGMSGIGKSTLVQFLGWWWGITELIRNAIYYSLAPDGIISEHEIPPELIRSSGRPFQERLFQYLQEERRLFVLDDFDATIQARFTSKMEIAYDADEVKELKSFINRLKGGRSLVIIISRCKQDWLGLGNRKHYHLHGLTHYHSTILASSWLQQMGLQAKFADQESTKYLGHLVSHLDYNPMAILMFLQALRENPETKSPKALLEKLQTSFVSLKMSPNKLMCLKFVRRLKLFGGLKGLLLHGLAPLWKSFRGDWFEVLAEGLDREKPGDAPSADEVRKFFFENAIGSGWIEIGDNYSSGKVQHFRIHPLLSNELRETIDWGENHNPVQNWKGICTSLSAFYFFLKLRYFAQGDANFLSMEHEIHLETSNYLFALGSCIDNMSHDIMYAHAAFEILFRVWSVMTTSNMPDLPVESLHRYGDDFLRRLVGDDDDVRKLNPALGGYFLQISNSICEYLVRRNPERAAQYLDPIMKSFPIFQDLAAEDKLQIDILYAVTLLNKGLVTMYKDRDAHAAEAYMLSAINTQVDSGGNETEEIWLVRKKRIELSAYASLIELCVSSNTHTDRKDEYEAKAIQSFEEYSQLLSQTKLSETSSLEKDLAPAELIRWALSKSQRTKAAPLASISQAFEPRGSGLMGVTPLLLNATQCLQKGQIKEARQHLLNGVHRAMLSDDKHAEYPCQQLLAEIAVQNQDLPAASLHIRRLVQINEVVQGGYFLPIPVFRELLAMEGRAQVLNLFRL